MGNYNWSEPESLDPVIYANQFGEVTLVPVTGFMPVSEISRENLPEIDDVLISLDNAEKVTLITENRRVCMSICYPFMPEDSAAYAVKYSCSHRAAVCRVSIVRFQTPGKVSAAEQIESMAQKTTGPIPFF